MTSIEVYNDKLAKIYDEATKNEWFASIETNKLLADLIKNNLTVLDIGIGTGQSIDILADKDCDIYGVDISSAMLLMTKQKYPQVKTVKYDISQGLGDLKFRNDFFDIIIAVGVLEFADDIQTIFGDAFELSKLGGHLLFTYELLIDDNRYQHLRSQGNTDGYIEKSSTMANFELYRRDKQEISTILNKVGYRLIRHYKIKAFYKGPNRIPVYYGVVLAQK